MIEHLELFAGAGGSALGFYNSGLTSSILAVENNLDALSTLTANQRSHFETRAGGELMPRKFDLFDNPDKPVVDAPVWLLSGGFPCQPFSVASGKHRNTAILDLRGMQVMITHVMACKPKIVFMENVPGFREADNGNAYRWLVSSLRSLGYVVTSQVVNMAHHKVPQQRKRLIILAWLSTEIPPLVNAGQLLPTAPLVTLRQALKDVPPSIGAKITPKTAEIYSRVTPGTVLNVAGDNQRYRRLSWDEACTTITTTTSGQSSVCHPDELRRLTVREVARVMTFPDSYAFQGAMSSQYKQLGNAVPPLFTEQLGRVIIERLNRATMGKML